MTTDNGTDAFEGMEGPESTALGFGGKTILRRLHRGDTLYLVLRCDVISEGEKEDSKGKVHYTAGARTAILAEISESQANRAAYGKED